MTALSLPIKGLTAKQLAVYFHVPEEWIQSALMSGARTYSQVWDHITEIANELDKKKG
jgi:hypothetical protein